MQRRSTENAGIKLIYPPIPLTGTKKAIEVALRFQFPKNPKYTPRKIPKCPLSFPRIPFP